MNTIESETAEGKDRNKTELEVQDQFFLAFHFGFCDAVTITLLQVEEEWKLDTRRIHQPI